MCSNTNSGSYGDLQKDDHYNYGSSCPKKQKKDRVRRRGPGVAELEKIRLQQEHKSTLVSPSFDHTLFVPPPPKTSLYTTTSPPVSKPPPLPATDKLPSPVFPFLPDGSFPKDLIQSKQQHSSSQHHHHHHHHMMNLLNPSPRPGGFYQFIELPSNQRSRLDDDKKIASKRPWHFHTDTKNASVVSISKESKQNRSVDMMRLISPVQDSGTTIPNPIAIDSSTTFTRSIPSNYPRFIPLSLQFEQQQKEFDENMQRISKKPGDQEQQAYESASEHGIDLSLKL